MRRKMEKNVIEEIAEKIGKTSSEVWALINGGLLTVDYRPLWPPDGYESVDKYRYTFILGMKG